MRCPPIIEANTRDLGELTAAALQNIAILTECVIRFHGLQDEVVREKNKVAE